MQSLKLFLAFLAVQLYAVFRGKATTIRLPPRKFLIVQLAKLGDIVCATPVPAAIKSAYPTCRVTVISTRLNQAVLEHNPHVDEYVVYNHNFFSLVRQIRAARYDGACLLIPNFIGLLFLYLGKIPAITAPRVSDGWSPYQTFYYRSLLARVITMPHRMGHYAPGEYLRLLEPWSILSTDTAKHLGFSVVAKNSVNQKFKAEKIVPGELLVGISPSAGNKIKCWEPRNFGAVANYLSSHYGATIVIIGAKNDQVEVAALLASIASDVKIVNTTGQFSIDELKAAIAKLQLFISVDSGPVYIAEAFGVPTIDIVGPMDEREQPPQGEQNRIVKIERKAPQLHIMNARVYDAVEARRQIESITPEMVCREIDFLQTRRGA